MNLHVRPRVNYILDKCKLPQQRKFKEVSAVFKEDCCLTKSNYRPITICRSCRKHLELYFAQDIRPYFESIFSRTYSDTGKKYGTDTALLSLAEQWRKEQDQHNIIGIASMNFSKAFNSLPHKLIVKKLKSYGADHRPSS